MKSYFLTSLFPDELYQEILTMSKGPIANANNRFQWNLFNGLKAYYPNIELINFPNVGAFPTKYKSLVVSGSNINFQDKKVGYSYPFPNPIYLKHYFKYKIILHTLDKIFRNHSTPTILFIYDLYPPFLQAISKLKSKYKAYPVHVCLIIPDLYDMTGSNNHIFSKYLLNRNQERIQSSYQHIDSYVLISKYMKENIPVNNKPWVVIEGIYDKPSKIDSVFAKKINKNNINLFYSGAIDSRNGVSNLLKAFQLINSDNYRLTICGDGPLKPMVKEYSLIDKRINYLGQLPHSEIISLQKQMDLLINPRLPGQSFTKYSFPSKTMEYFASGSPCLMYQLEGTPLEYSKYCYLAEMSDDNEQTIALLSKKIKDIFDLPITERKNLANRAQNFILNCKNPEDQCRKIYNMITEASEL